MEEAAGRTEHGSPLRKGIAPALSLLATWKAAMHGDTFQNTASTGLAVILIGIASIIPAEVLHARVDPHGHEPAVLELPGTALAEEKKTPLRSADAKTPNRGEKPSDPPRPTQRQWGEDPSLPPEEEGFLDKLIRIFYGPDRPRGPDPDVDTNISAGGAGG